MTLHVCISSFEPKVAFVLWVVNHGRLPLTILLIIPVIRFLGLTTNGIGWPSLHSNRSGTKKKNDTDLASTKSMDSILFQEGIQFIHDEPIMNHQWKSMIAFHAWDIPYPPCPYIRLQSQKVQSSASPIWPLSLWAKEHWHPPFVSPLPSPPVSYPQGRPSCCHLPSRWAFCPVNKKIEMVRCHGGLGHDVRYHRCHRGVPSQSLACVETYEAKNMYIYNIYI